MVSFKKLLEKLPAHLNDFAPYPASDDRSGWNTSDPDFKSYIIREAEKYTDYAFIPVPAVLYMDFCRTGNRVRFENVYFTRRTILNVLVLAECLEHAGRFIDTIINGIYALCEESGWQLPAHNSYIRDSPQFPLPDPEHPVLDLFACETGCQLAVIHYLLHTGLDAADPAICRRIETELRKRIITPYLTAKFWWMGYDNEPTNNWTAWCTQNILITAFIPGICSSLRTQDTDTVRRRILKRAAFSMDRFLSGYGEDGCCSEGAQYYRHAGLCLFNALEVFNAAGGGEYDLLYKEKKIRNIAEYIVNVHVSERYYLNFGDCAAIAGYAGIREFLFGKRCGSLPLMALGSADWKTVRNAGPSPFVSSSGEKLNLFYLVQELFTDSEARSWQAEQKAVVPEDIFYKSTGLFISRDAEYCLAVKAGSNGGSHSHNDTGSIILYKNGKPFIIDLGVETYSRKTFSPDRYDIWTMQSVYHNVTNFSTVQQLSEERCRAEHVRHQWNEKTSSVSMELSALYPPESNVDSYRRSVVFQKGKRIIVTDILSGTYGEAVFTLMTAAEPELCTRGKPAACSSEVTVGGTGSVLFESPSDIRISIEPVPVSDQRLRQTWPGTVYRILVWYKTRITAVLK